MASPSLEELDLLEVFRLRLKDLELNEFLNSDTELLRWIRARENNLDQAELMVRKHMKWRQEIEFDQIILWEHPKQCEDLMPEKLVGFDSDNSPVIVSLLGKWDTRRAIQAMGCETVLKYQWKSVAQVQKEMQNKLTLEGVPVSQICNIIDLEGLSLKQGSLQVLQLLTDHTKIAEANFPEFLKVQVIINSPRFFPLFFKCCKPFLSETTKGKIHIYGKNREEWMRFLKGIIPDDVLPRIYGGSNDISLI